MKTKQLKPGQKAPVSAQYLVVGPRNGSKGFEVQVNKGNTMPPTRKGGTGYVIVDPVKNASGKQK